MISSGIKRAALLIHFDESCSDALRSILLGSASYFQESGASEADVILFGTDDITTVERSRLYADYRSKSLCITESDIPTFRLPGLYAANTASLLTRSRTRTISYFMSERQQGNEEVKRLRGKQVERRFLYSFMGGSNSWARKRLFRALQSQADTIVEATNSYNHWTAGTSDEERRASQRLRYAEVMAASKFTLCPRGCGLSSYRLFESMSLGVAPVIISDAWQPIDGLDWSFALRVREKHIPELDRIVRTHEDEWQVRGAAGLAAYNALLAENVVAQHVHSSLVDVLACFDSRRESIMAELARARCVAREAYWAGRKVAKLGVLWAFHLAGKPLPINLNRPIEVQLARPRTATRANHPRWE